MNERSSSRTAAAQISLSRRHSPKVFLVALLAAMVIAPATASADETTEPWISASPESAPIEGTVTVTGYLDCSGSAEGDQQPLLMLQDTRLAGSDDPHLSTYQYWGLADLNEDGTFSNTVTIPTNLSDHDHPPGILEPAVFIHPPVTPGQFEIIAVCWPSGENAEQIVRVSTPFVVTGEGDETTTTTTELPATITSAPTTVPASSTSVAVSETTQAQVLADNASSTDSSTPGNQTELARTGSNRSQGLALVGSIMLTFGAALILEGRRRQPIS
ncbi:MAG: hypothetical protein KDB26_06660 [Microthrixaceae bacterium]|nr:hypothetical protein [Microthrixaceae bacterium]